MMKVVLLVVVALVCVNFAVAQPPPGDDGDSSASCDMCGASATYTEEIVEDSSLFKRTIVSSGCPNHYNLCTGKDGVTGCGAIGEEGSDTEAKETDLSVSIPANPVIATTTTDVECEMGAIGYALNGVAIYSGAVDDECNKVDVDDDESEWTSFDICGGHAELTGEYHYHFPPPCLHDQAEDENPTSGDAALHSPQLGWALDGFPIYGPKYTDGELITQDDLDACSGKEEEIPSLDNFKYRYYMTGAMGDRESLTLDPKPSNDDYPFTLECYVGCTWEDLSDGSCTGSDGTTDGYSATAHTGYSTEYTGYPDDSTMMCNDATDDAADDEYGSDTPVHCVGAWTVWDACSVTCGGGTQMRTYQITTPAENGGDACDTDADAEETQVCSTEACPVDCVGAWGDFGDCSLTCGGGLQSRTYNVTLAASDGGMDCSYDDEAVNEVSCNSQMCSTDDADACADVACGFGSCVEGTCVCDSGYEGSLCAIEIAYCSDYECGIGYSHISAHATTECDMSDDIDGDCTTALCCEANCDANMCGGCADDATCSAVDACTWESGTCQELKEVEVSTTFTDVTTTMWADNKEAYDSAFIEGLSEELQIATSMFGEVTTMTGSTVASASVTSTKTAATVAAEAGGVDFDGELDGQAFDPPEATRACSSASCTGCAAEADCTGNSGCLWDTACYTSTCSPTSMGVGCSDCTTSTNCDAYAECQWASDACSIDEIYVEANTGAHVLPSTFALFFATLFAAFAYRF